MEYMEVYQGKTWTARLGDDGTLDTLIIVTDPAGKRREVRFDHEYAANFRNEKTSAMTRDGFKMLASEAVDSEIEADALEAI